MITTAFTAGLIIAHNIAITSLDFSTKIPPLPLPKATAQTNSTDLEIFIFYQRYHWNMRLIK